MAMFSMNDADNYGVSNKGSFFQLKNDKEVAKVRFLYKSVDDVPGYSVHTVKIGDRERYVNCLREYNEPIDKCPLCQAGNKIKPRLFVKLYNETAGECQLWERGKNFFSVISGLSTRYNPLYNEIIEIERSGKPGDLKTQYNTFPIENKEIDIDEYLKDCPEPLGLTILDKTAEEMKVYIETGNFESADTIAVSRNRSSQDEDNGERPVRRRSF